MAKLTRVTGKVFGSAAQAQSGGIGQFGSAATGTPNPTTDVATIQALQAYLDGWGSAVITSRNFPPIEEVTGVLKTISYQACYTLQEGIPEYDINTEYSNTSVVKSINNGITTLYVSLANGNTGNPLTDTTKWKPYVLDQIQRNIGEIVTSTIPLTDAGLHLLDGSLLQSGSYASFVSYIADLYDSGDYSDLFDTEANWQTAVSTYGVCGKFVYDSVNNTVRLPKYSNKIYTSNISSTAPVKGNGMTMGLTNGQLNAGLLFNNTGVGMANSGTYGTDVYTAASSGTNLAGTRSAGLTTDGAKSGIIADLANITSSVDCYYYIVVATSTKTDIEVDIDEIATDLNGKADVDLTNTVPAQSFINSSTGWTRIDFANGISLTINSDYTCPSDGCLYVRSVHVEGAAIPKLTINSTTFDTAIASGGYVDTSTFFVSVSKNDVVKLSTGYTNQQLVFFPLKGV